MGSHSANRPAITSVMPPLSGMSGAHARDGRFAAMPVLTVLSGPSGVGKGTVVARVRQLFPHIWVSVSCTTRHPRPGEREGVHYRYLTRERFAELRDAGELL